MPIWQAPLLEYLIFALVSFSTSLLATATLVNVTVDDSEILNGSAAITYAPLTGWNNGADCASCDARPDPSRTWGGTWHDSTYPGGGENHILSASLIFNGSAIYVFCIISHSTTKPSGNSNMTFFIDGGAVGGYFLAPSGSETYDYNVLVYANNSLTPGTHSLTVQNGAVGAPKSLMLLDYIVYSQDNDLQTSPPKTSSPGTSSPGTSSPPSVPRSSEVMGVNRPEGNSSSSHRRTIVIAATVSGAVVLIGVAVAAIFLCCRRRPEQQVYPYNFPAEDITEDPSSSGWVEDAWGRHEGSGVVEHPSLASGTRTTEALRGDPTRRDKGKGKGSRRRAFTESAVTPPRPTASPLARAARWSQQLARTAAPVTPTSSTGAVVAFEMTNMGRIHRHPYAAPTPEPDIELDSPTLGRPDTGDHIGSRVTPPAGSGSFAVSSASMPERIPEPNPTAAAEDSSRTALLHPASPSASTPSPSPPAPAPVRARSRPLPMQPVLESQAHAARSRRFNSPSTPGGSTVGSELPPPYPGTSRSR